MMNQYEMSIEMSYQEGITVATIPYKVLSRLVNHPLTDSGNAKFLADWDTVPDNDIVGQVSRWLEKNGS